MKKIIMQPAEQKIVVLVEREKERTTMGGIIIPATADDNQPEIGIVVAAGTGSADNPMTYGPGHRILFSQYAGMELKLELSQQYHLFAAPDSALYKIMNQMDVVAKIMEVE